MHIECTKEKNNAVVKLTGELDHHSAKKVRDTLDELIEYESISQLTLEMSGVSFMDSTGIGVILGRFKKINERGGTMKIENLDIQSDFFSEIVEDIKQKNLSKNNTWPDKIKLEDECGGEE